MRKTQQQTEVRFPSVEGQLSGKENRAARWEGRTGRERWYSKSWNETFLTPLPRRVVIQGMKSYLTLGQFPPCIFLPPSSPMLGPAAHSERRAAPSTINLACQEASPPRQIGPGCSVLYHVLENRATFLVALCSSYSIPSLSLPRRNQRRL